MNRNNLILIISGILLPLILIEGVLRLAPPKVEGQFIERTAHGARLIPNSEGVIKNHRLSKKDIEMRINSLGLRDEEIPIEKPENETRVLVLGDSITWGDYLQADEVYVERAEAALNRNSSTDYQVINAGIGDIGISEEVGILKELGPKLKPELVIISFYLNDSRPPWGFMGESHHKGWWQRNSRLIDFLFTRMNLQGFLNKGGQHRLHWVRTWRELNWANDRNDFMKLVKDARYDWGAAWDDSSWTKVRSHLEEVVQLSKRGNFKIGLALFPPIFQVESEFIEDLPQRKAKELANELDIPLLDILPLFRASKGTELFFDQCHPTEIGNNIAGEALAEFINRIISNS